MHNHCVEISGSFMFITGLVVVWEDIEFQARTRNILLWWIGQGFIIEPLKNLGPRQPSSFQDCTQRYTTLEHNRRCSTPETKWVNFCDACTGRKSFHPSGKSDFGCRVVRFLYTNEELVRTAQRLSFSNVLLQVQHNTKVSITENEKT